MGRIGFLYNVNWNYYVIIANKMQVDLLIKLDKVNIIILRKCRKLSKPVIPKDCWTFDRKYDIMRQDNIAREKLIKL